MPKPITIIGARPQLGGDCLFCEPILNYWKLKYPNSKITWVIAKKCQQFAKFYENHPFISEILISDEDEGNIYTINGKQYNQKTDELPFDVRIPDFNPSVPRDYTYNSPGANCVNLAWKMASLDLEEYHVLPEEYKRPRIYCLDKYNLETQSKHVGFLPFAGYAQGFRRSPTVEWWQEMIKILIDKGYTVKHYGHFNEPILSNHPNYINHTKDTLFNQILDAVHCESVIGTDSGSSWYVGAANKAPIISLNTYSLDGHHTNPCALAPMHYSNKQINLFHPNSCSDITHEEVLSAVKSFS